MRVGARQQIHNEKPASTSTPQQRTQDHSTQTTLVSSGPHRSSWGITSVFSWGVEIIGHLLYRVAQFLQKYVFWCFSFEPAESRIDWQNASTKLGGVVQALNEKNQKKFSTNLRQLEGPAKQRFGYHTRCAIGKSQGKTDVADQERFAQSEEAKKIRLSSDYYAQLGDQSKLEILKEAAQRFQDEINRNLT